MTGLEKRKKKAIDGAIKFFDWVEWTGHLPGMHSEDRLEKKLAYWMIHLKQGKKGTGSCVWYDEIGDIASRHHVPEVFDVDTRIVNYYESFAGMQIGPYKVKKMIKKSLSPPVPTFVPDPNDRYGLADSEDEDDKSPEYYRITDNFISYWNCVDSNGDEVEVSAFTLIRTLENSNYIEMVSKNPSIKKIASHNVGPWFLLGFIDFHGEKKETIWLCKRNDDLGEVERVILPPLNQLLRLVKKANGNEVDPVIDQSVGYGVDDMTGRKCQYWTVVGFSHKAVNKECMWYCVCDCGKMKTIAGGKLRNGNSKSCGCYRNEVLAQARLEKKKEEVEKENQEIVQVTT